MSETPVLFEIQEGAVALITINRPARRNALDAATSAALSAALARFEADADLRVAVLCGAGPVFCAGMDLAAFGAGEADAVLFGPGGFGGVTEAQRRKPLIAAVHGAALAGGFELALACDMIVAEAGCRFGVPEVIRGLVAGAGGALRLASMIPPARAREIILTGRMFETDEAWDLGLIARRAAAGEGVATALALAREIAANAPLAVAESLRLSRAAERAQLAELWPENARTLRAILASEDAKEGAKAFLERRAPQWRGR